MAMTFNAGIEAAALNMTTRDDLVRRLRQQARNRTGRFGTGAHTVTVEWQAANRISDLERQLAEAMEVLEFYASPFEYVQNHRLDEQTPDFYDELNTGERAQNFLDAAAIRGGAK
jgi:hypothetical protein